MHAFHPLSADCGQLQRSEIGSKWFFGGRNGSMNMFIRGGGELLIEVRKLDQSGSL